MGENIGAVARAMKNFGLSELRIVSPRDGWPNAKADAMSVGAIDIIKNAKIYDDLPSAIANLEYVYATTATPRDMNKNYVLAQDLSKTDRSRVGIMFGRENCGLTNEEISYANIILTIDTDPEFSSLNIAHSVAIICYELFKAEARPDLSNAQESCSKEELEYFFEHLFGELEERNFFRTPDRIPHMTQNIRAIFNRIDKLSKNEVQTLRGVISYLSSK
jgi:tRNA/rRNA methyltransferase